MGRGLSGVERGQIDWLVALLEEHGLVRCEMEVEDGVVWRVTHAEILDRVRRSPTFPISATEVSEILGCRA